MNYRTQKTGKYIKFALYAAAVILINIVGVTLFLRLDLTKNKIYSLSPASKAAVATLSEPLTVKVFFTRDLPAPHNGTELYLRDLLNEYVQHNRKFLKIHHYNVSADIEGISEAARANQQMAREYGISPVQIQHFEKDEVKFKQAYMGVALIHGDVIEQIPSITSTEGLEYRITTVMQKLNRKVSALLKLDGKIKVRMILTSNFYPVGKLIGLKELDKYADDIKALVERMNAKAYNRLEFERAESISDAKSPADANIFNTITFAWPDLPQANVKAGRGVIGLIMQHQDKTVGIPLLNVVQMPLFGERYQLVEIGQMEQIINANLERMIQINEDIGYLADYGTHPLSPNRFAGPGTVTVGNITSLLNQTYNVKQVSLKNDPIPQGLKCLIIAGPRQKISEWALYQIDQALMNGTNLAFFVDFFEEKKDASGGMMMGNPMSNVLVPLNTGLEKMLEHYGLRIRPSVVMDEKSYRQRRDPQWGGGEMSINFIPLIESANINKSLDYMKNIKGLFVIVGSPLELNKAQIDAQKITAHELFSSSDRSWEAKENILLHPMYIPPPASDNLRGKRPLAYMLEGKFTSYFKGKTLPVKPADDEDGKGKGAARKRQDALKVDTSQIKREGAFRENGVSAKIFVVGSSRVIGDQVIDAEGQNPNATFALNVVDVLNDRSDVAVMRSKEQSFNPLNPTSATTKFWIKTFNIAGLPLLTAVFGLLIWWRRQARKKKIRRQFEQRA